MPYDPQRDSLDPEFRPLPPEARADFESGVSTNVSAILLVAIIVIGGLFAFYYYGTHENPDRMTTGSTRTEQSLPKNPAPLNPSQPNNSNLANPSAPSQNAPSKQ